MIHKALYTLQCKESITLQCKDLNNLITLNLSIMKKIIIAIDYNPSAEKVAEAGYEIAKALQAELTLVHVITEPAYYAMDYSPIMGYSGGYTEGTISIYKDIKKQARDFLAASARHLGDADIKTKVLAGDDVESSILKYCKSRKTDMIIIGSHSHKGLKRIFGTDVAAHLLRHSNKILLIIPTGD